MKVIYSSIWNRSEEPRIGDRTCSTRLGNLKRTHYCGALRAADADKDVVLMGWVHRRRDLGQLIFIDLRDRAGIAQIVFNKELHPEAHAKAEELRSEFVVAVEGRVLRRQKAESGDRHGRSGSAGHAPAHPEQREDAAISRSKTK